MPAYSKSQQLGKPVKETSTDKAIKKFGKSMKNAGVSVKPRKPLKKGKKTTEWDNTRRILNQRFYAVQIERCELNIPGKHNGFAVAYAHAKKRNDLLPGELIRVVKACEGCHSWIEYKVGKEEMQRIVDEAIARRPAVVNKILLQPIKGREA
jgi:hypothetical protein